MAITAEPRFLFDSSSIDSSNRHRAIISRNSENVKRHRILETNLQPLMGTVASFDTDGRGTDPNSGPCCR